MIRLISLNKEADHVAAKFKLAGWGAAEQEVIIRNDGIASCSTCGETTCIHSRAVFRSPKWGKAFLSREFAEDGGDEESGVSSLTVTIPLEVVMDPLGEHPASSVFRNFAAVPITVTLTYRERSVAIWAMGIPDLHSALRVTVRAGISVLYYVGSVPYESSVSSIVETIWPWAEAQPDHAKRCILPTHRGVLHSSLAAIQFDPLFVQKFTSFPLLTRGTCLACATSS